MWQILVIILLNWVECREDWVTVGWVEAPKLSWAAKFRRYSLAQKLSQQVIIVLGVTFRLTSLWTSTLLVFAHRAFIGCANYDCVGWSLDLDSTKTLVHAFIASCMDYCNAILARSPVSMTDKLQRLMNAAARLVIGIHKFDHGLSWLLHDDLHWLDIPERIQYKIGVTVHRCLQSKAPKYLTNCCTSVSEITSRRHLRSASQHHLSVPLYQLSIFCRQAFSVAGPMVWNSLPGSLRNPALSSSNFRQLLKTYFFNRYSAQQRYTWLCAI